jgi:hypothetical protein
MSKDLLVHALDVASKAEVARLRQLDDAVDVCRLAEAAFIESGSDSHLDAQTRATAKLARARKLHADAVAARQDAQVKVDAADLARAREQHAADLLTLPHYPDSLQLLHDRLIELDRQAFALLTEYDRAVEAGQSAWDAAKDTAARVGSHLGSIARPTLADALLAGEIAATEAREADDRDSVADLFDPPIGHGDWRQDSLNAAEREAAARNTEATKERMLVQAGAHMQAMSQQKEVTQ